MKLLAMIPALSRLSFKCYDLFPVLRLWVVSEAQLIFTAYRIGGWFKTTSPTALFKNEIFCDNEAQSIENIK